MSRAALSHFPYGRFGLSLGLGTAGGTAFYLIGMPLPFMLGSMCACMIASLSGIAVAAPMAVRPPMSAIIGTMIGASLSPAAVQHLPTMGWSVLFLLVFTLVGGAICTLYFYRIVKFDLQTAYFAGMPGGIIDMVQLAEEKGADPRKVAVVHTLRVVLVVITVPLAVLTLTGAQRVTGFNTAVSLTNIDAGFLFWFPVSAILGILLGKAINLPAKYFVGPMLVGGLIHLTGISTYKLPYEMVIVAQIVLGATIGCRFVGITLREIAAVAFAATGSTALLLAFAALCAWIVELLSPLGFLTVFLSYAPGGLAEISLLAFAIQIEIAIVTTQHILRIVIVGFGAPLVLGLVQRLARDPPQDSGS